MDTKGTITIVVVCDDHYLILLAALIKSIETNHRSGERILLYVVEDGVKAGSKKALELSADAKMTSIKWLTMSEVIPAGMKLPLDRSSYPLNIYMRLFIPYFIPEQTEKVLYLDVDMIMLEDVSKIYNYNLADNVVGAVLDPRIITVDNGWGGILNYKELGLAADTRYFNTGLLLINTKRWREQNVTRQIIDCIDNNKKYANYPDQYGLNVVLANKWAELDPLWNYFSTDNHPQPFLIHFVSRKPIYKTYNSNPEYKDIFYSYLNKTQWKGTKPIGESSRYVKKMGNVLNKLKKMLGV